MVRTRFAPSPTGFLHVGGLRTALYNYLYAKKNNGAFILRIEDTDRARYVEGALENLLKTLEWVGLDYEEGPAKDGSHGPYVQSERTELYRKYARELVEKDAAYLCFCTSERLDEMREKQSKLKQAPMYDRACLKLSPAEIEEKKASGTPFVIRQKIPRDRILKFNDLIRGLMRFDTNTVDDQVLMKSDSFPTYHLANVIDDHLMEISHVIRGEEWLPSTPKHILLYEAFGWQPPEFAHIPLLLNKDKSKLSKRQGDVSVEDYINKGYIREAIINFIALLGWHPGKGEEKEIFSLDELVEAFSLEKVHKGGAVFEVEKLDWFNFQWQKKLHFDRLEKIAAEIDPGVTKTLDRKNEPVFGFSDPSMENLFINKRADLLLGLCEKHLPKEWLADKALLGKALITVEEKILNKPAETPEHLEFYFSFREFPGDLLINAKMNVDMPLAEKALTESLNLLTNFNDFDSLKKIQEVLLEKISTLGLKNGQVLWPLRLALSGRQFSPGVFEIAWVLGKEETLKRIKNTLKTHFDKAV